MTSSGNIEAFLAEPRNIIVAGIRRDGRPQLSPNWFYWDGERFYVSTTRDRAKYAIFRRDPRAQLLIDDPVDFRAVLVPATVEIREDLVRGTAALPCYPGKVRAGGARRRRASARTDGGRAGPSGHHTRPATLGLDELGPGLMAEIGS